MSELDLNEKKQQIKTLQEKCELQNKKIKLFRKENEQLKNNLMRQSQTDTAILLSSKELSEHNTKLQATISQLRAKLDQLLSAPTKSHSSTALLPLVATLQSITVDQKTQEIELCNAEVNDDQIAEVVRFTNIKSLTLGNNKLTDEGVDNIVTNMIGIQKLQLDSNCFTSQGLKNIKNLSNLKTLQIRNNNLGDVCLSYIKSMTTLLELSISKNNITDHGARSLATLTGLYYLDLTNNWISDEGVNWIVELPRVNNLYLMSNRVLIGGVKLIIEKMKSVEVLDVRFNINASEEKEEIRSLKPQKMQLFC